MSKLPKIIFIVTLSFAVGALAVWVINNTSKSDSVDSTKIEAENSQEIETKPDDKVMADDKSNDSRVNDKSNFISYIPPQGYSLTYSEGSLDSSRFGYKSPDYKEGVLPEGVMGEPCIEQGLRISFNRLSTPRLVNPETDLVTRHERAANNEYVAEWYYLTIGGEKFVYQRFKDNASECSGSDGSIVGYRKDSVITMQFNYAGDYTNAQKQIDGFVKSILFIN